MESRLEPYFVTIRIDEERTRDYRVMARSAYNAQWLYHEINPQAKIVKVRPVNRSSPVNS